MANRNFVPVGTYALYCLDSYASHFEGVERTSTLYVPADVAHRLIAAGFILVMDGYRLVASNEDFEDMLLALPEAFIVRC